MSKITALALKSATAMALLASAGHAQDGVTYTNFGTPGLIEMPSAISAPDGQIAAGLAFVGGGEMRTTFTFQITPRLSGSFRYAGIEGLVPGRDPPTFYDRSFDLRYRFTDEGDWMPAIAVGLQDFLGTGVYGSEYLVATKTFGDNLRVTGGLGWGRMGTYNGFANPFGLNDRPLLFQETIDGNADDPGGTIGWDRLFHGDAAFFGGVEWAPNDNWLVKVEYSSDDAYVAWDRRAPDARGEPLFDRRSPLNFGVTWRARPGYQVSLGYLYGSQLSLSGTLLFNPNNRPFEMGLDSAPVPVAVRGADARAALTWDRAVQSDAAVRAGLAQAMAADGFDLDSVELTDRTARIRYTNGDYRSEAQGLGRVARIATVALPASVSTITLEPMQRGIPLSAVTFRRTDLEEMENESGGTQGIWDRALLTDAGPRAGLVAVPPREEAFSWGIAPYLTTTLFDGDNPIRFDVGLEASAEYRFSPNLVLSGALRQTLTPQDDPGSIRWSELPPVRRFAGFYAADANPGLRNLQLAYYDRPAAELYSRVTVGYLEPMFGGVSAELLYKPVATRWAVSAEVNYVAQRDTDMLFGFGDYCHVRNGVDFCQGPDGQRVAEDYDVVTGHLSFYYAFENGFHTEVNLGRYLSGDWGATFALDREFENGWRVGAYATLTDVSAEDFGEGSFDKGIRVTVPFDFILGTPSRRQADTTLTSLSRDGGARLNVEGRLYDVVREGHAPALSDGWGRFWR